MDKIKSGEEFLRDFFEKINNIPEVERKLANKLKELYEHGKLTDTYIKNMLDKLIEEETKNED